MNENRLLRWLALAAIVFGLVTVASGGRALFGSVESRAAVDHAVPLLVAVPLPNDPMKSTLSAVLFIVGARLLSGQDVLHTLVPPPAPVASGASVRIALVGLNPTAGDAPFNKPLFLAGNLTAGGRTLPVELQAEIEGPNTIRAGAFARRDYVFVLPRDMSGRVILEVAGFGSTPLRTVILAQSKD
eukprot:gene57336-76551_t